VRFCDHVYEYSCSLISGASIRVRPAQGGFCAMTLVTFSSLVSQPVVVFFDWLVGKTVVGYSRRRSSLSLTVCKCNCYWHVWACLFMIN
jgi:hypothetical protein